MTAQLDPTDSYLTIAQKLLNEAMAVMTANPQIPVPELLGAAQTAALLGVADLLINKIVKEQDDAENN